MKLTIEIELDNAAFDEHGTTTETGRILRDLAIRMEDGALLPLTLRDHNGNKVGTAEAAE